MAMASVVTKATPTRPSSTLNKAMSETALFRLHQRIGPPVVTLRPPVVYGPRNSLYREAFFWDRLRANRSMILPATAAASRSSSTSRSRFVSK
jgi:nucleoside-diphosphate-sugar epimerase